MKDDLLREIKAMVKGRCLVNEMMPRHTTLGVGGPADFLIEPIDLSELKKLIVWACSRGIDSYIIGSGSNILVSDKGIRGIIIRLTSPNFRHIEVMGEEVICGAGARIADLLRYSIENGLGGLEFLASIPGTVGGAVAMNAGAWGGDIAGVIKDVTVIDEEGATSRVGKDGSAFGYRRFSLQRGKFIISATLGVKKRPPEEVEKEISRHTTERKRRFPAEPSAGSIFKNPEGDYAGRLIEAAGLKGRRCGGAQISTVHANFIVNLGGARAEDVLGLIDLARERVMERFGIELETEIDIFGEVEAC